MAIDVISQLPQLTWGGRSAFCSSIETSGGNRLAPRVYPYVNGAVHDDLGANAIQVRAKLHFLNSIPQGGDAELYPGQWVAFRELLTNGERRTLAHPDLGEIQARVVDWGYAISPASISGVSVDVSWEQSIDDPDEGVEFTDPKVDAKLVAEQIDEAMGALGLDYPTGIPEGDLLGSVNAIIDTGFSVATDLQGEVNKITGALDRIESSLERTIKAIDPTDATTRDSVAGATARWQLQSGIDLMRAILAQAVRVAQSKARATGLHVVQTQTSLVGLAQSLGNSIAELLDLNPQLSGDFVVRKGTAVTYYV